MLEYLFRIHKVLVIEDGVCDGISIQIFGLEVFGQKDIDTPECFPVFFWFFDPLVVGHGTASGNEVGDDFGRVGFVTLFHLNFLYR